MNDTPEQKGSDRQPSDEVEKNYISVWLMPEHAQSGSLRETVEILAERFGTHPFEPHLTIISSFNAPPGEVKDALFQFTGVRDKPFKFEVDDVVIGDVMTKTLYVTFKPVEGFEQYCEAFKGSPTTAQAQVPQPHLSLIYKEGGPAGFTEEQRENLTQIREQLKEYLKGSLHVITFNKVSLVVSEHTLKVDSDVNSYETVATYPI